MLLWVLFSAAPLNTKHLLQISTSWGSISVLSMLQFHLASEDSPQNQDEMDEILKIWLMQNPQLIVICKVCICCWFKGTIPRLTSIFPMKLLHLRRVILYGKWSTLAAHHNQHQPQMPTLPPRTWPAGANSKNEGNKSRLNFSTAS